jgi:hypothetical protein
MADNRRALKKNIFQRLKFFGTVEIFIDFSDKQTFQHCWVLQIKVHKPPQLLFLLVGNFYEWLNKSSKTITEYNRRDKTVLF